MGTLPDAKLKSYSSEYASFIGLVAKGWEACGNDEIAEEEREHHDLWKVFAKCLGHETVGTSITEVSELVGKCKANYTQKVTAPGALYAFEALQPKTAESKLEGLQTHYKYLNADKTYFKIHVNNLEEPAMLLKDMEGLSSSDQDLAVGACADVAESIYGALTGIMEKGEA